MSKSAPPPQGLFADQSLRRRRVLILPKYLYGPDPQNLAEAQFHHDEGPDFDRAVALLKKWAAMETKGLLKKKETALDANFLNDIFGQALRYAPVEHAADGKFTLDRQLHVPNVGPVDGALGFFPADKSAPKPLVAIELKGADTDLDTDKSNGRTAVQQLFDYLNALPDTKWGIVSNFSAIRLYHKDRGSQTYEVFSLQKLAADLDHFKAFWCLFEKGGLLPSPLAPTPRADRLLTQTGERQKEVGDELYEYYAAYRNALIATLRDDFKNPLDEAVRVAQKIFDRIIFVAFSEETGFFPANCLHRCLHQIGMFDDSPNPRWRNMQNLFYAIYNGHNDLDREEGIPISLFQPDVIVDECQLDDGWAFMLAKSPPAPFSETIPEQLMRGFPGAVTALKDAAIIECSPAIHNWSSNAPAKHFN